MKLDKYIGHKVTTFGQLPNGAIFKMFGDKYKKDGDNKAKRLDNEYIAFIEPGTRVTALVSKMALWDFPPKEPYELELIGVTEKEAKRIFKNTEWRYGRLFAIASYNEYKKAIEEHHILNIPRFLYDELHEKAVKKGLLQKRHGLEYLHPKEIARLNGQVV